MPNDVYLPLLARIASSAVQLAGAAAVRALNDLMSETLGGATATEDRPSELYAHEVMTLVSTGDEQPWTDELEWLWTHDRMDMIRLLLSVIAEGIREPVTIGNDGRLWDGHHRVAIAAALGIKVPVQYAGPQAKR